MHYFSSSPDYSQPDCYPPPPCQDDAVLRFCPTFNGVPTCSSSLSANGGLTFEFTGRDIEYTIKPQSAVYNVSQIEFFVGGIQLVCNESIPCSEVKVNQSENSLSVNCNVEPGIGNFNIEIVVITNAACGIDRRAVLLVYGKLKILCLICLK